MKIYGYTKVRSECDADGKESHTFLFSDETERDKAMYKDYAETFDSMNELCQFENGCDDCGQPKQAEEEFMKTLAASPHKENDVFGLIQAYTMYVQFEPLYKEIQAV